ncbi:hypothetical protein [Mesorhizobium sp. BR-1-1-10]|uniref:hypothetical protein n=1 Tax=Mesorhizobium sp. BR-1-1-10 TaxID=2876660 RepID=UPI001CD17251|nr:hypothetical protein [Mesorhizobium sp. BR-1-1-10]MBZ9975461.1 hypothetical protein [Mesorhizobium sp. BR-1-1-10]
MTDSTATDERKRAVKEPKVPAAASDTEAYKFSVSLPAEYEQRMAVDPVSRLPTGGYNSELAPLAAAKYGGKLKNSNSAIVRLALDELWERRNDPNSDAMRSLGEIGLAGVVIGYRYADFSHEVRTATVLYMFVDELALFMQLHEHRQAMKARFRDPEKTTIIMTSHPEYSHHDLPGMREQEDGALREIYSYAEVAISAAERGSAPHGAIKIGTLIEPRFEHFVLLADEYLCKCSGRMYGFPSMPTHALVWKPVPDHSAPCEYYFSRDSFEAIIAEHENILVDVEASAGS